MGVKCEIFGVVYLIADYSFACPTGTWVPRCTLGKHTTKTQKFSRTPSYFCRIGTVTVKCRLRNYMLNSVPDP